MVDWKLYIDSPQKQALKFCGGALCKGGGYGNGTRDGWGDGFGDGWSYGSGNGNGWGWGIYGNGDRGHRDTAVPGNGGSSNKW